MRSDELKEILRDHAAWLKEEGGAQANLAGADLTGVDLSGAILNRADFKDAILTEANLSGASLRLANLSGAYMRGAQLDHADLEWAILTGADLSNASMDGAALSFAALSPADLEGTGIVAMQIGSHCVIIQKDRITIGCQRHSVDRWMRFADKEIEAMGGNPSLWRAWKPVLQEIVKRIGCGEQSTTAR